MFPILKTSARERRWSIFGWSIGISAYIALNILVYASIRDQAQALNNVISHMSPTAKALFSDNGNFLSPVGYLSSKVYYLILPLLFTMLGISLSNSLLRREEQDGTLELLLSRPVSRTRLYLSKLISAGLVVSVVALITLAVTVACANHINFSIPVSRLALTSLVAILLSTLFASVAWMLGGVSNRSKRFSVTGAAFFALATYLITSLESVATWLKTPAKFMPYHYYQPSAILEGHYNWWHAAGLAAVTIVLFLIGLIGFRRRDIG